MAAFTVRVGEIKEDDKVGFFDWTLNWKMGEGVEWWGSCFTWVLSFHVPSRPVGRATAPGMAFTYLAACQRPTLGQRGLFFSLDEPLVECMRTVDDYHICAL